MNNKVTSFLEKVMACTPGSLYWKDREGRYLGCNDYMLKTARLSTIKNIIGKTDCDLWGETAKQIMLNDQKIMQTGETVRVEEAVRLPSGEMIYFIGVKMPLWDNAGNIVGIIGNSLDITELKLDQEKSQIAKDQAESANRAKSTFLANMSHDLKTPLSGILSTAENLLYKLGEEQDRRSVQYIMQSSARLMDLLNEVIQIAKLEHHDVSKDHQVFKLSDVLNGVIDLMRPALETKKITFTTKCDSSIPEYLLGSKILLHRILLNLLSNAIKFTDSGFIRVLIEPIKQQQKKVVLKLVVQDTGIGIPKDKQSEIFESFTRIIPSYKSNYKGTGLGLYIVKQYATQLGGEVTVDSEIGKGSTFTCLIPFSVALDQERFMTYQEADVSEAAAVSIAEPEAMAYKKRPIYILVIEDEPGVQRAIKEKLSSLGYFVDIAETGQKALQRFEPHKYDLIYMDIGLPDMDGYDVAKAMREIEKSIEDKTPIIALTAHADIHTENACLSSHINGFLTKPLMRKQAQQIVEKFVIGSTDRSMADIEKLNLVSSDKSKAIDLEFGAKIVEGDVESAREILAILVQALPEYQADMESAYLKNDIEQLKRAAHKFHGALSYSSALKLKVAVANLETHLNLNHRDKVDHSYQIVQREINLLLKAYEELLSV